MTPDFEGALKFYGGLLGWTFEVGPPELHHYTMCKVGGRNAAGIGKRPEGASFPSAWSVYFDGDDADRIAESIRANGGQIMTGPMDVMDLGRMLVAADPTGAVFGVWEPRKHTGAQVVEEPGATIWHEVDTRDNKKAADFYCRVFGLEARKREVPGIDYMALLKGPKAAGGVLQMDEQWPADLPPHWMAYFAVADVDASIVKVQELGGKVHVPPFDTPYGRQSVVADPWGAAFTLMTPRWPLGSAA
ncbi:hydroxylase [Sorangium cellulosum]|uniref:Hydroxylase n=1 Tax=Sorangium cellulosum TaxID=56 RepID=A0A150T852_SORCE|nr:hydroxylase [Sorangium cellulosum]KYG00886.1 hydroxylase [Sorangium cellulosum]